MAANKRNIVMRVLPVPSDVAVSSRDSREMLTLNVTAAEPTEEVSAKRKVHSTVLFYTGHGCRPGYTFIFKHEYFGVQQPPLSRYVYRLQAS